MFWHRHVCVQTHTFVFCFVLEGKGVNSREFWFCRRVMWVSREDARQLWVRPRQYLVECHVDSACGVMSIGSHDSALFV